MMISFLMILVPSLHQKGFIQTGGDSENKKYLKPIILKSMVLFSMLGMGFMLVEISFIQRFGLFLGQPVLSLTILLLSLLGWAGIGSLWSDRFDSDKINKGISIISLSIVIIILSYTFLLPLIFDYLLGISLSLRLLVNILILSPLGILMGFPFPLGMRLLKELKMENHIPWMWGINGASSVLGSVMTIVIAISFGFNEVLFVSAGCYFIIFLIFWKEVRR